MGVKTLGQWLCVIGVFFSFELAAQNYFIEQALLFSRQNSGGSARIQALGGAQVALGGDYSSALSNPAGLGFYNRNEFAISTAFSLQSANTNYTTLELERDQNGNAIGSLPTTSSSSYSSSHLSLPGLAIVFGSNKNEDKAPFLGGTFAITLNRVNDFNGGFEYKGQNNGTSMIDYFIEVSNGLNRTKDQFNPKFDPNRSPEGKGDNVNTQAYLGYNNYLFGPARSAQDTLYSTDVTGKPFQSEIVKTAGAQNQWSISYGANFSDKLFLGAGLGIMSVKYSYDKTYKENYEGQTFAPPCNACFNNFQLNETRSTSGSGVNLTLGIIYKPIDLFQFGASYVTPSAYQLEDTYTASMTSSWNNFDYYGNKQRILNRQRFSTEDTDPDYPTDPVSYGLSTPSRFTLGGAFFIPKKGFITADVELVNYGKATTNNFGQQRYTLAYDADLDVNSKVKSRFQSVTNIRVGSEYRISKFRVRAGVNFMGDPYSRKITNRINYSLINLSSFSVGLGYRKSNFYVDMAVIQTQGDGYYLPYAVNSVNSINISPYVNYSNANTRVMFTVGFPF
jgi:Outer membrane protein transport protein (OMPP1/FadL/TodX)